MCPCSPLQQAFQVEAKACLETVAQGGPSAGQQRKRHANLQERVKGLWNSVHLFDKAISFFKGQLVCIVEQGCLAWPTIEYCLLLWSDRACLPACFWAVKITSWLFVKSLPNSISFGTFCYLYEGTLVRVVRLVYIALLACDIVKISQRDLSHS